MLKELTMTVDARTAEQLQQAAETMQMTIGEVVDRLAVMYTADDPDTAAILMGEYLLLYTAKLSEDDFQKAAKKFIATLELAG